MNCVFNKAFSNLIKLEGEYVNDADDAGGETKFGISKKWYPHLDIKNLSRNDAMKIYYDDFWKCGPFEKLKNESIAVKLFELTVNIGQKHAGKCIQRALRCCGYQIAEDGIIGTETISKTNTANYVELLASLRSEAAGYYRLVAEKKPDNAKFLEGWLKRAYS